MKKFLVLLVLADLAEGKPEQIIRMSLVRAKFCEQIAILKKVNQNPPTAFLTGMLSHIDGVLDQGIAELMNILPVHKEIKTALVEKNNYLATYLALSLALAQGLWHEAKQLSDAIDIKDEDYLNAYQESIRWADSMLVIARH